MEKSSSRSRVRPEIKVYGIQSCLALAQCRSADIVRAYVTEERIRDFSHVLKMCAAERKAYHVVTAEELEKVTESRHHEGVCLLARQKPLETLEEFITRAQKSEGSFCLMALEEVANPHNVGAILRVAAHFGVDGVLLLQEEMSTKVLSSAVFRTAEGGVEYLSVIPCREPAQAVRELRRAGFRVVATSSHASDSLYSAPLPERSVIFLGSEAFGLSHQLLDEADRRVAIPGSGHIESLNVATAAAVCLGEYWRQHKATRPLSAGTSRVSATVSSTASAMSAVRTQRGELTASARSEAPTERAEGYRGERRGQRGTRVFTPENDGSGRRGRPTTRRPK